MEIHLLKGKIIILNTYTHAELKEFKKVEFVFCTQVWDRYTKGSFQ